MLALGSTDGIYEYLRRNPTAYTYYHHLPIATERLQCLVFDTCIGAIWLPFTVQTDGLHGYLTEILTQLTHKEKEQIAKTAMLSELRIKDITFAAELSLNKVILCLSEL